MAALFLAGQLQAATSTWVAFNDHAPGTIGTQTAANATTNTMRIAGGPFTLKNITDGSVLPNVAMTVTLTGAPANGGSAASPNSGTPLYNTFNGYCYFGANVIQVSAAQLVTVTFTGLDPSKRYKFQGGSVRGDTARANRWTKCNLIGADSAVANHQQSSTSPYGIITSVNEPTLMTGFEVAYNSGINLCGDMIEWDEIAPGTDGSFAVTSTQWYLTTAVTSHGTTAGTVTPNATEYGYAIDAFRLEEFSVCSGFGVVLPANPTATECTPFTLTANILCGTPPYTFLWLKDGSPYTATEQSIVFSSIRASDGGSYSVYVEDSTPQSSGGPFSGLSEAVTLTVNSDSTQPTMVGPAFGPTPTTINVTFSKPVSFSGVGAFTVVPTNGTGALSIQDAVLTDPTHATITTTTAREAGRLYKVVANAGITTCNELQVQPNSFVTVADYVQVLAFTNHSWQYNESGTALSSDWLANGYDDHSAGWLTGTAPFVAERGTATTVAGYPATQITLTNPATLVDFPSYYFRTHVNFPANVDASQAGVMIRHIIDDGVIIYVNGTEAYRTTNMVDGVNTAYDQFTGFTAVNPAVLGPYPINPSLFTAGDNVIEAYLKQVNNASSDAAMGLEINAYVTNYVPSTPIVTIAGPTPTGPVSVPQCGTVTLSVTAQGGTTPYHWQWFYGNTLLTGETSASLVLNNIQPAQAGNYHVRVTDSASTPYVATSTDVSVTVTPVTLPTMIAAFSHTNLTTITLDFSGNVTVANANAFIVQPADGGADIAVTNVTPLTGSNFTLRTASALSQANFNLKVVGSGVTACAGAIPANTFVRIGIPVLVFGVDGTTWNCNQSGVDFGSAWLANSYNDTDAAAGWTNGPALFDGKIDAGVLSYRTATTNFTVRSFLNLLIPTFEGGTNRIPTYYFKKHLSFPSDMNGMWIRPAWDDGGAFFVNGQMGYSDRFNLAFTNYATGGAAAGDVAYTGPFFVPATNVIVGAENIIAVELKQQSGTSSDVDMGLELWASVTNFVAHPRLTIRDNGATYRISWDPAGGTLWSSSTLLPGSWTQGTAANPQDVSKGTGYKFFQVRQ